MLSTELHVFYHSDQHKAAHFKFVNIGAAQCHWPTAKHGVSLELVENATVEHCVATVEECVSIWGGRFILKNFCIKSRTFAQISKKSNNLSRLVCVLTC